MQITSLSDKGDAVLVQEEGDVLRAYRCPAGVWSISTGLTAASGVVTPRAGMVITPAESKRLRRLALSRNYEPAVAKALPTNVQHVFDGALLWHWNCGAIARASWVKLFRSGQAAQARLSFLSWNKAGGKVLNGLVNRRAREWSIIESGYYGSVGPLMGSALSAFADHARDFEALGFDVSRGAKVTVIAFQRAHNLTQDALIGPATRAAIKRALDKKAANTASAGGAAAGGTGGLGAEVATNPPGELVSLDTFMWLGVGALSLGALVFGATLVWRYRGPIFSWLPEAVKDFSERLGVTIGRRIPT